MGRVPEIDGAAVLGALGETYAAVTAAVAHLPEEAFDRPTRCDGWSVRDVLFHMLLDPQRSLVAFASTTAAEPTTDFVSYWRPYRPGTAGAARTAEYVRRGSAAYLRVSDLVEDWRETSEAALRAAAAAQMAGWARSQVVARTARRHAREASAPVAARVRTQGLVIAVPDLLATLTVEAALHHLDITVNLPDPPAVPAAALEVVRLTLDGLLGAPLPATWDGRTCALKGTGRTALDGDDRHRLGPLSDRFPLLG